MVIEEKIAILADAAKFDVSCSSSGSSRSNNEGLGNTVNSGICHSWSDDGRCISLFKILMTNKCVYDCKYCISRCSNDTPRAILSPEEISKLTIEFYKRNYIEGLFLSSAVDRNPDYSMENMFKAIYLLRKKYEFNGYIHVKIIPNSNPSIINKIGYYADRVSLNLEFPDEKGLEKYAPQKKFSRLLLPMNDISRKIIENKIEIKESISRYKYVPAGQTTQMMVGASKEDSDYKILKTAERLYSEYKMKRVYYSAFINVNKEDNFILPYEKMSGRLRENRLYQADWLIRFYKFKADEILNEKFPDFDTNFDPKINWALNNMEKFPIEINKANYQDLIRVPGIGIISAQRIIKQRKFSELSYDDTKKIGVVLKRAKYFITCKGRYYGGVKINSEFIRTKLIQNVDNAQISFF